MINNDSKVYNNAKSWPFEEAKKLVLRVNRLNKTGIILETGYGPSGLPHIGTFGEVLRTTLVMNAFRKLMPNIEAKLYVFSDDSDGFRKVPTNVPNQEMLKNYLEMPLTSVPDPFGKYESFAHHNNAMLRRFLDSFNFEYEFKSSTEMYKNGVFNNCLKKILENFDEIMKIMLPSLREERQKTYSPILPISPITHKVLQVPIEEVNLNNYSIIYTNPETNNKEEVSALDGNCKLQWKADWGMRWVALCVDYEMNGKDLIDSFKLSSRICKVIGGTPPENLTYELFLDEEGKKISKSKGNGLSIDEWLKYAPEESLAYYMFQSPKRAKKLYFDVIPSAMDGYIDEINKFYNNNEKGKTSINNKNNINSNEKIYTSNDNESTINDNEEVDVSNSGNNSNNREKTCISTGNASNVNNSEKINSSSNGSNLNNLDTLCDTAVFHIHNGNPPNYSGALKFSLLLNLVQACNTNDENVLMQFIYKYLKNPSSKTIEFMKKLSKYAINYYNDFIANNRKFEVPNETQVKALNDLKKSLKSINSTESDILQNIIFEIGKTYYTNNLKEWFISLYKILFGSDSGPRMGSFISLYGIENTIELINKKLEQAK